MLRRTERGEADGRGETVGPAAAETLPQHVLPDLLAFVLGLAVAYFLKWETRDLVWSLWLGSLVLGYLTVLSTIGAGAYLGLCVLRQEGLSRRQRRVALVAGTAACVFFLTFFSFHFCGFHAGHSVFLGHFFPLEGLKSEGFIKAFMNPPLLWALVFRHLMVPYGLFLIPALIAERKVVFGPLLLAFEKAREARLASGALQEAAACQAQSLAKQPLGELMRRPYQNVIRMHLLIFFFGFCHMAKVSSFVVYAAVYFVYFFPWGAFRRSRKSARVRAGGAAGAGTD